MDAKDKFRQAADSRCTTLPKGFYTSPNKNPEKVQVQKREVYTIDMPEHHLKIDKDTAIRLWHELDKYFGGSRYIVKGSREPHAAKTYSEVFIRSDIPR